MKPAFFARLWGVVLSLVFCLQALSSAQFSVARIVGSVVDQSGAPFPGIGAIGCADNGVSRRPPAPFLLDPPVVDPRVPARSDLVAYFVLQRRIDDDDPSECRLRYRATVLRTATSPRYGKMFLRTIDVRLKPSPIVSFNIGSEYIAWLTWRADRNAFDTGDDAEGVLRRVEDGRVKVRAETYSVDELFKIFEDLWVR